LQAKLAASQPLDEEQEKEKNADVNLLLDDLEQALDVAATQRRLDITEVPQMEEYLKYFK
jgi:hypothetical protein